MHYFKLVFFGFGVALLLNCERCMECSYSYTETTIIQTVNGEEEQVNEFTGAYLQDENGQTLRQECIKEGDFTIENAYEAEKQTTDKDNFEYECVEQ